MKIAGQNPDYNGHMFIPMLPNILSASRIVLASCLLLVNASSAGFFALYLTCGATDMLDGYLARRLNAVTRAGRFLDVAGDFVFVIAIVLLFFRHFKLPAWLIIWTAIIGVVRVASWVLSYVKLRFIFTHTYLDRATGTLLFLLLPFLLLTGVDFIIPTAIICLVSSVGTAELMALSFLMKEPRENLYSVFEMGRPSRFA